MKALFLTSSLGGYRKVVKGNETIKEIIKCDNSNHFIDRLKFYAPKIKTFVFIASGPDMFTRNDDYSNNVTKALNLDDFEIENLIVVDHRFKGNIEQSILSADVVFLSGGHVPTQNKYFKEINLKEILKKYSGVVIGQSAGSMNCGSIVYAQPENKEEFYDKNFQKKLFGLGLVNFSIMPHMNKSLVYEIDGTTTLDMCLKDSYNYPHYGIVDYGFIEVVNGKATAYGETTYLKNGKQYSVCENGEHVEIEDKFNYENLLNKN